MLLHMSVILFGGSLPQRPSRYGGRAGRIRPTGMHACLFFLDLLLIVEVFKKFIQFDQLDDPKNYMKAPLH